MLDSTAAAASEGGQLHDNLTITEPQTPREPIYLHVACSLHSNNAYQNGGFRVVKWTTNRRTERRVRE